MRNVKGTGAEWYRRVQSDGKAQDSEFRPTEMPDRNGLLLSGCNGIIFLSE